MSFKSHILTFLKYLWKSTKESQSLIDTGMNSPFLSVFSIKHFCWKVSCFNLHVRNDLNFFVGILIEENLEHFLCPSVEATIQFTELYKTKYSLKA